MATLVAGGCSEDGESAEEAAERLAAALESGELPSGLVIAGQGESSGAQSAQSSYDRVLEGLGGATRSVAVAEVTEADRKADVTLQSGALGREGGRDKDASKG